MGYKAFQKEAIKKIVGGYDSNQKNNRFLVADEVGLGKTFIAKGTIRCLFYFEWLKSGCLDGFLYNVLYLCSNLNIAEQNKSKLGVAPKDKVSLMNEVILGEKEFRDYKGNKLDAGSSIENRTTMLLKKIKDNSGHEITAKKLREECIDIYSAEGIQEKEREYGIGNIDDHLGKKLKLNIIPITTKTSIDIKGDGHSDERKFIQNDIIQKVDDNQDKYAKELWENCKKVCEKYPEFKDIYNKINENKHTDLDRDLDKDQWQSLRRLVALGSIELLKYDFVIMDEFQNFSEVLQKANDTQRKKLVYMDRVKLILSALETVERSESNKWIKYIKDLYQLEKGYDLSNDDKNFWNRLITEEIERNPGIFDVEDLDELIFLFGKWIEKSLEFQYAAVEKNHIKQDVLNLLKCIIERRDNERVVNRTFYNLAEESFSDNGYQYVYTSNGRELAKDIYLKKARESKRLYGLAEKEQFLNAYREIRKENNAETKQIKKSPFEYLLNIHFTGKEEETNLTDLVLSCFIHFLNDDLQKQYLWQYSYLLTKVLREDPNRLKYSVEQLEPMRIFLGVHVEERISDISDEQYETIIIDKIFQNEFQNDKYTKILMLSATPFKMYIDKKNSNEDNVNIVEVCDFLDTNIHIGLASQLIAYKNELIEFSFKKTKQIKDVLEKKNVFQKEMNRVFTRMERYAVLREVDESWFKNQAAKVMNDEMPCGKIPNLFEYIKQVNKIEPTGSMISYAEDAPYMATFMHPKKENKYGDGYTWKREFNKREEANQIEYDENSYIYLDEEDYIKKEKPLGQWHGVYESSLAKILDLDVVINEVCEDDKGYFQLNHPGASRLLWIPSCVSGDKLKGAFKDHKDYGKTIIFSRLVQVPRMIAGLSSYETLRRLTWLIEYPNKKEKICEVFNVLFPGEETRELSSYQMLAKILEKIDARLEKKLLSEDGKIRCLCRGAIERYCEKYTEKLEEGKNFKVYININKRNELADCLAKNLVRQVLLNRHMGMFSIWASKGFFEPEEDINADVFATKFIEDSVSKIEAYCVDGCLSDVLDEWLYICLDSEQDVGEFLGVRVENRANLHCLSFIKSTNLTVSLYKKEECDGRYIAKEVYDCKSGENKKRKQIQTYFARCIGMSGDDDKVSSIKGVQQAFNSPFAPFVFATTSMGQEGLDFHYYADKIIHWRLPANPVDFEQREGRINRYHCLALRKKLMDWYRDGGENAYEIFQQAFENAKKRLCKNEKNVIVDCGLVPDWILLDESKEKNVKIKRYVPYFYLSKTNEDFNKNLMVLQLYRSVIGQTNPEEVMSRLMNNRTEVEVEQLFVDFSPYNKQ